MRQVDHLIFATPELGDGARQIGALGGVTAAGGGQHLGHGTHNTLLRLGPRIYLEIIAPDPAQPEPSRPRPYGVDGITRSGLVGWAIACEDITRARDEARAAGHDPGDVIDGHRVTPDGKTLRWQTTSNARTAGLIPFLISWGTTEHPAATAPPGLHLASLHLEHPDPESLVPALRALGADVTVVKAARTGMLARLVGRTGSFELR